MAEFVTRKESIRRLITVVVCAALSLGGLVMGLFAYRTINDEEKPEQAGSVAQLRREVHDMQVANQHLREGYREFSRAFGWSRVALDSGSRAEVAGFSTPDGSKGLAGIAPDRLREYLNWWVTVVFPSPGFEIKGYKPWSLTSQEPPQGPGKELTLIELFDILTKKEGELKGKIDAALAEADRAEKEALEFHKVTWQMEDALLQDIDRPGTGLKENYKSKLAELKNNETKYRLEIDGDGTPGNRGLTGQVVDLQNRLTELRVYNSNLRTQLAHQKKDLESRLNWLIYRAEEARERKDPDGEVLAVEPELGIGFIDLIHRDRIFRGGRFKVYSLEKGGEKRDKGEVEILEVSKDNASKVAVYSLRADDPIKSGDRIYHESYERGKPRNIAIAGRLTGKLSNEDAIRKIKEFGDVYQERVTEKTNYLVVGEGYEEDPNFKISQEYGVKIMIEKIFQEYLGVP